MKLPKELSLLACAAILSSCISDDVPGDGGENPPKGSAIELKNHSMTPNLVVKKPGFNNLEVYSLLSSEDTLEQSPGFVYGSMADGAGVYKNADGTYTLINNAEADYSVMRITLDSTFKPVKGEYILNSVATANTAQCSGTLVMPEEHGFGPLYLSGGEWGGSSTNVFATDPERPAAMADAGTVLPAMGQWTVENAVPLHKDAYPGKTVVLIGDDSAGDAGGQLAMYVSETTGDLENGKLYALKIDDMDGNTIYPNDVAEGGEFSVTFEEMEERTYDALEAECISKGITGFNRVEDIDYRKGSPENNREIYFNATGRTAYEDIRSKYGRTYKLILDEDNPLKGKLSVALNGDDLEGPAKTFHSPDNILVTENYAYIQEDPNGYADNIHKEHDAYLYQYNLRSGKLKVVLESGHRLPEAVNNGYASADDRYGKWELTGMIDISDVIGVDGTFILIQQGHSWHNDAFLNPDGAGSPEDSSNEGSIMLVLKGLKR
ncbi:phosphatase [Sinomicrobium weinanense]|uniref:Phosphatase n=1 Tax=Sinomicrobium weinanense TaxID=2842200 RepID=A0A926Q139_9FLAO|nr:phosphatase [Sinomicrobium weinanense]MBC9795457.1 phosphatase [Sinomicrobium weinanense]MBU3123982.1 PhoX family protein [Sinomicrobium weinanense]